ncbi:MULTISPECIES: TetR/AcrR family transcriptional regulator [unclassified Amycolatopsis]|uniref:TetR/AcrR family transcriptional regulator n=1 Tax=Amycolatopsis TaxID=1813 RepID=UPI00026289D5|nr:TetR/AcrR family transcriptional regulator [Amycolatopsis sp. ATCC 39116]
MVRWEPNAPERLSRAALELFTERGYDNTTVAEIAERTGLTKRTFFRHFADKREVLFGGQDALGEVLTEAITGAPATATPLAAIGTALEATAVFFGPERLQWAQQRQAVIDANPELQERELLKLATLTTAFRDALRERGTPEPDASLTAEIGNLAFRLAFTRWIDPANQLDFAELTRRTLDELREAAATLA